MYSCKPSEATTGEAVPEAGRLRAPGLRPAVRLSRLRLLLLRLCAGRDRHAAAAMIAESVARASLMRMGLPSWRSDAPPGTPGRYGLCFDSGRRALVGITGRGDAPVDLDRMLSARCDLLLVVRLDRDERGGSLSGFATWDEIMRRERAGMVPDLRAMPLHPSRLLPGLLRAPRLPRLSMLVGTVLLLLLGEPPTPPPARWRRLRARRPHDSRWAYWSR